jgi:hypothetical protein
VVFAFAAVCITAGVVTVGVAQAVLLGCGILLGITCFGLLGFIMLRRAELLRSEPHLRFMAVMAWSQDPGLDEETAQRREKMLPGLLEGVRKAQQQLPSTQDAERDG